MCNPQLASRNTAIASIFFSIVAILAAIVGAATPVVQYFGYSFFFGQGAPTVQLNFNLAKAVLTGAVSGTSTYRDMLTTNCGGWCEPDFQTAQDSASVNLRAAFASAALAGPGAEFFYALAIICLIVQTISNVNFLCNNACCIPVCNTPIVGLAISVTAFLSMLIAAPIVFGMINLGWAVSGYINVHGAPSGLFTTWMCVSLPSPPPSPLPATHPHKRVLHLPAPTPHTHVHTHRHPQHSGGPSPYASGAALLFATVSFSCEMSLRCCTRCKREQSEAPSAPTVVSNPINLQSVMAVVRGGLGQASSGGRTIAAAHPSRLGCSK